VLLAEQAAQCSLKGLLHGVGRGDLARGHSVPRLAASCREHAALADEPGLADRLAHLAREYESSRYPDALPEGLAPSDFYTREDAERALTTADDTAAAVASAWDALLAAVDGGDES